MNERKDFTWQLIHTMSTSEKLFFKRNFTVSNASQDKLYIRLFDAISAQKEFDEAAIIKKFKSLISKKNIAAQKHYLQRQLCEALAQYESRESAAHEIYKQLLLIKVFRKKGLIEEAHSIWKKAMARAREIENYSMLGLLKTEFEKMILFNSLHASNEELYAIFKGHIISYQGLSEVITLRDIYAEIILLKKKAHFDHDSNFLNRIKELSSQIDNMHFNIHNKSFWFLHYFTMSKATLFFLTYNSTEALKLLQQAMAEWKKQPSFVKTESEYYVELLYMINYVGIQEKAFEYVVAAFNDPINDQLIEPAQRASYEAIKYLALNKIYNKTGQYDEVKKLLQIMKKKYAAWEPLLNADINRTVNLSMGIAFFVLDDFNDAYYFTNRSISYFKKGAREEHTALAQILLLLIAYNLNNSKLFDAQQKTTYTYFYKRKKKHPFEAALVHCLSRTFYMKNLAEKIAAYEDTLALLDAHKNDTIQRITFGIFNYPGWLKSKVLRLAYRDYVAKELNKKEPSALYEMAMIN